MLPRLCLNNTSTTILIEVCLKFSMNTFTLLLHTRTLFLLSEALNIGVHFHYKLLSTFSTMRINRLTIIYYLPTTKCLPAKQKLKLNHTCIFFPQTYFNNHVFFVVALLFLFFYFWQKKPNKQLRQPFHCSKLRLSTRHMQKEEILELVFTHHT